MLLLSPDFMDSDYIIEKELPVLIARNNAKRLEFFPVLISPCSWDIVRIEYPVPDKNNKKDLFLLSRLLLPGHDPEHPIDSMPDSKVNKVFKEVTKRILAYHKEYKKQIRKKEKTRNKNHEKKLTVQKGERIIKSATIMPTKPSWASHTDMDEYGHYVDVTIKGITLRMRWIEPGEFLMGSPPKEPERRKDEYQYRVVLSTGFWLADTACTQELWQAVMETSPSQFKGDNLPVENISWDMSYEFIRRCNLLIQKLTLRLPTEAEWEYSCRAGSTTPFFFGENINTNQVNYYRSYPYYNGKKGKYRGKTVPVRSLPCNKWGLYQMHGNVWEWCSDWYDVDYYRYSPVIDPPGPEKFCEFCILRGGSWNDLVRYIRSACRVRYRPGYHSHYFGFRLARGYE